MFSFAFGSLCLREEGRHPSRRKCLGFERIGAGAEDRKGG